LDLTQPYKNLTKPACQVLNFYKHCTCHISRQWLSKSTPSHPTQWRCWRLWWRQLKCHN